MISFLPKKHIRLNETIIGLAPKILNKISNPIIYDEFYFELKKDELFSAISVDDYLLCLDYLYAIGKIKYVDERIVKNDN